MHRLLYLVVAATILFISCKKENTGAQPGTPARWQWDRSIGGVGSTTIEPSANTSVVLILSQDMTYKIEKNGQVALSDSFQNKSFNGSASLKFKNYGAVDKLQMYPEVLLGVENGQLVLSDVVVDGMVHYFRKQ